MLQMRFVPVDKWPGNYTRARKDTPFNSTYPQTLDLLETELRHLRAKEVVLQAHIAWDDIRNDGIPRANAPFTNPGVILTFESSQGPLSFPCDTFRHWHSNLRAIALALEALRKVNRYGVTRNSEQYQGWRKLGTPTGKMSRDEAAQYIAELAGDRDSWPTVRNEKVFRDDIYRKAARNCHPDAGGSHDAFVALQEAMRALEAA